MVCCKTNCLTAEDGGDRRQVRLLLRNVYQAVYGDPLVDVNGAIVQVEKSNVDVSDES